MASEAEALADAPVAWRYWRREWVIGEELAGAKPPAVWRRVVEAAQVGQALSMKRSPLDLPACSTGFLPVAGNFFRTSGNCKSSQEPAGEP